MRKKMTVLWAGIGVLLLAAGVYYFRSIRPAPVDTGEGGPTEAAAVAVPDPAEAIEPIEVDLNTSDALVRRLVAELSSRPTLARWLASDHLIRRFVSAVDLVAKGDSPRRPLDFIDIEGEFRARKSGDQALIDSAGYRRYDTVAGVIASLDARGSATLYRKLRLPIEQAYREMGYPVEAFDATLRKALSDLLETPVVESGIALERGILTYTMTDPELEGLSSAQKHFLRMGPENMRVIRQKLEEIAHHLGWDGAVGLQGSGQRKTGA